MGCFFMNDEALEILKMHALQLLSIQLEGYDMDDMKGISNHIKTPFINTTRKQFKNELKHFIVCICTAIKFTIIKIVSM